MLVHQLGAAVGVGAAVHVGEVVGISAAVGLGVAVGVGAAVGISTVAGIGAVDIEYAVGHDGIWLDMVRYGMALGWIVLDCVGLY